MGGRPVGGAILCTMSSEQQQLQTAIDALEAQRSLLGDAVVALAVAPLRAKLASFANDSAARPQQSLKHATMLFMDVVGSTTLSQQLDPEEFHAIVDGVLVRGTRVVEAQGGKIISYAGDNLIAVFGATEAREDAAERAVHTGLSLLNIGRALHDDVLARYGHAGCQLRVGIHTGPVLLGGGVQADHTISGLSVNIAARMEQSAPPGGLRISHATYAQVRGVFDVEAQQPIAVKGLEEPVQTYLVQRAKTRAFRVATRGIEGIETRMIGRDAELEALQRAFRKLYTEPRLALVTVVADAGVGKSRLLYEFDNWSEARAETFTIFQGRANPQIQTQPYGLLRDILAWRFQLTDGDSVEQAKGKLVAGIVPLFAEDGDEMALAHAHLLGQLIGLDFHDSRHILGIRNDAKQIRNRAFHAAAQIFRRVAQQSAQPVVLQLDDLQWADDASLDFLNYLVQVNRDVPLLIIALTRPTLFERRSDWVGTEGPYQRIDIAPLDKTGSRLLANELLKNLAEVPAALRELITGRSDGNPFYMEELVKMLIDQGAIETQGERWSVNPAQLLSTEVPATLTGVLQARLDGLPADERLALQQASVIGLVFWDQALAALDPRAAAALPALVRRELTVARADTVLDNVREYAFRHQILHQVTYDTLLKRSKRELHAKVADWLAHLTGARSGDFLGATAEHYLLAGNHERAAEYFARAAEQAGSSFAHAAALGYVARALHELQTHIELPWPDASSLRWRLLDVRERTLDLQGKRDAQIADLDALDALADAMGDDRRRSRLAVRRSRLAMRMADYPLQERSARQAMVMAERAGEEELRLQGLRLLALAQMCMGEVAAARTQSQEGLAEARRRGLRHLESLFLNNLSLIAEVQGDQDGFMDTIEATLSIARAMGDKVGESTDLGNRGKVWLGLGELGRAHSDLQAALELCREVGDRHGEGVQLVALSQLALRQGDEAHAMVMARLALEINVEVQAADFELLALCRLADAELALGRTAQAAEAFARAEVIGREIDRPWQLDASAGRAMVALAAGDAQTALACLQPVLAHLEGGGTLDGTEQPRLIELTCYQVLGAVGDARASDYLAQAHHALQTQASAMTDALLRHSFLTQIPEHRAIVAAWDAASAHPNS